MASFHIVENGVIVNVILADTKEIAELVTGLSAINSDDPAVKDTYVGATLDEQSGVYVNPPIEAE
jgi:hypothetical protein